MIHWLNDVFTHPTLVGCLIIAGKTTAVYFFLVGGLRLLGKRELGQMTVFDLVLLIVLANAVQNAMIGTDSSLAGGLIAGLTLLLLNRIFNIAMARSKRLRLALVGEPLLIVNHGHLILAHMAKEGITKEQVMAALREHGLTSLSEAQIAVLEIDGTISVVPAKSSVYRGRKHFKALRLS